MPNTTAKIKKVNRIEITMVTCLKLKMFIAFVIALRTLRAVSLNTQDVSRSCGCGPVKNNWFPG